MDKVARIGVSLEPELLDSFDAYISRKGFPTRSEAIRELIKGALVEESIDEASSHAIGTITLVYNHHKGGLKEDLMEIQHRHHRIISSSIHVHLDRDKCLEVVIVHGSVSQVMALNDDLNSVKGMLHGKPTLIAGEPAEHKH